MIRAAQETTLLEETDRHFRHLDRGPRRMRRPAPSARSELFERPVGSGMEISWDLFLNAIAAGLLLGAFYAAVTAGISISFGMLDIVNIAHPAFVILGSYIAYFFNIKFGIDPILISIIALPFFYVLGASVYQVYYMSFEKRGQDSLRGL